MIPHFSQHQQRRNDVIICIHLDQTSMAVKAWKNWQRQKWVQLTHNLASASFSDQRLPRWLVRWVSCTAASPLLTCRVKPGYFLTVFNC